jgi:hypothetical protein
VLPIQTLTNVEPGKKLLLYLHQTRMPTQAQELKQEQFSELMEAPASGNGVHSKMQASKLTQAFRQPVLSSFAFHGRTFRVREQRPL